MLDSQEIRWLKATANELNNLLQKIYGYAFRNVEITKDLPEAQEGLGVIVESVEHASQVTQSMLDYILACERYLNPDPPKPPEFPADKFAGLHGESPTAPGVPASAAPDVQAQGQPTAETPQNAPPVPPGGQSAGDFAPGLPGAESQGDVDFTGIPISNPDGKRELILVVDDEVHVTRLIQMMLVEAGYRVICAQDGFNAVQIYRKVGKAIDLVLLDFAMPIMDGSDVFEELRLLNPRVAVLLSSGFPQQAQLSQMLAKGLRGFMPKPYTREKMLSQIRSALDATKPKTS
jgi:CheY-like chemotaxis protein